MLSIKLDITSNLKEFDREFSSIFAHELTHAYENYCRLKNNNGKDNLILALNRDGYFLNKDYGRTTGSIGADRVKFLKYWLTKSELNAYINNIKQEIEYACNDDDIYSMKDILNIVKTTPTFKNVYFAYKVLVTLYKETNENIQNDSIEMWNQITKNKIVKNYNQLKKILYNIYYKRYRKFVTKISKLSYDIYNSNYNNKTMPSTTMVINPQ